ncbi:hypothetical protein P4E94_17950 [Pontiellaceae bacterium B12219]|nr:hypothetical protein [Pontiellaceae bacterium B12219]
MKQVASTLALLTAFAAHEANSTAIEVYNVQTYVGGTTTSITDGGSSANYNSGTQVGNYAVFDMQKDGVDYADLRVTYSGDDGTIGSDVLITQTSNSQGLTDTGTISILLNRACPKVSDFIFTSKSGRS